jgi:prepilin-type N-terminal cleavage/methylation domain-containing protein
LTFLGIFPIVKLEDTLRTMNHELKAFKGFTLIELLVAISIIGILAAIAIPTLTVFNRRQVLKNTVAELKDNLRYVQNKALAAEVDTTPGNCDDPDPNKRDLRGWYFYADSANSYLISGLCANPADGRTFGQRSFELPSNTTILMTQGYILFEPLIRGISFYGSTSWSLQQIAGDLDGELIVANIDISLNLSGGEAKVYITPVGEIRYEITALSPLERMMGMVGL